MKREGISRFLAIAVSMCMLFVLVGCSSPAPEESAGTDKKVEGAPGAETSPADMAEEEVQMALNAAGAGDMEKSKEHFEKALEYNGEHPRALCGLGTMARNEGDLDKAVELAVKAIEIQPDYVVCYDNLGITYTMLGEYEKAQEALDKAIELDPKYADAHFNLGMLYMKGLQENDKARESFEEYMRLSDNEQKKAEVKVLLDELQKYLEGVEGEEGSEPDNQETE